MEIQQAPQYGKYMQSLKWDAIRIDGSFVYLRHFPIIGGIAKLHRPMQLPSFAHLLPILKRYRVKLLAVEPTASQSQDELNVWIRELPSAIRISRSPFIPTKTRLIDLTKSEEEIFRSFDEAKRRGVRRAQKNNLVVEESHDITKLIAVKNKSSGLFGFITTYGIKNLWPIFAPIYATILLAGKPSQVKRKASSPLSEAGGEKNIVGGILLMFWEGQAYYWIAGATKTGKKLFAPTLLVWEALRISKRRGAHTFDFVGVWDERLPTYSPEWKGFTKFKEGFGGTPLYYPLSFTP